MARPSASDSAPAASLSEDDARCRSARLARMSPSLTLTEIAVAAGAPTQQKLAGLTPRGACTELVAAAAIGSDDTTATVALGHVACPPWVHRSVTVPNLASTTAAWRQRSVRDVGADGRLLRRCAAAGASDHLRHLAAGAAACPPAVFEALAHDNDYRIQKTVAANLACPLGVVMGVIGLAARGDELLMSDLACEEAAANPICPASVLRRVAAADNEYNQHLRTGAAANPNCPPELLDVLAGDSNDLVRAAAARNPSCPPELLARLASDTSTDADVAMNALMNPSCPEQTLRQACGDNFDGEQRHSAGTNPSCPLDLMERIIEDPARHIAFWVAVNPSCPPELIERSAADPSSPLRSGVARRRDCPLHLLEHLADDEDWMIRRDVVENPAAPHRVVVALKEDPVGNVRQAVADRLSEKIA